MIRFNSKVVKYVWLSNMYMCVFTDKNNFTWRGVEPYFQAHKCQREEDFYKIMEMNCFQARKYGRTIEMRHDWHDVKLQVMLDAIRLKFVHEDLLRQKLLETSGCELEEYAPWDTKGSYWGIDAHGCGENHTGKILMQVRGELARGEL